MTLGLLVRAEAALVKLSQQAAPAKAAYAIAKLLKAVEGEAAHYHAQREAVIKALGAPRPPTPEEAARGAQTIVEVTPEHFPAFVEKMREIEQVVVDTVFSPLSLELLKDLVLSGADVRALGDLLEG